MNVKIDRLAIRLRLFIVRELCRMFLPRDLWVGKDYGAYTQQWDVVFGRLDERGVLQGVTDDDAAV